MSISERIFSILKEKGISQKEFSEMTGIAQSTISDWKRKGTNPAADKIMVICRVLGIPVYELLEDQEDTEKEPDEELGPWGDPEIHGLLERYRSLRTSDKAKVLGYMDALQNKI